MTSKTTKKTTKKAAGKPAEAATSEPTVGSSAAAAKRRTRQAAKRKTQKAAKRTTQKAAKRKTQKAAKRSSAETAKGSSAKPAKRAANRTVGKPVAQGAGRSHKTNGKANPSMTAAAWNRLEIPEQQQFFLCSGQRLRNIEELAEVLDEMQKEIFEYHVNNERNDFHAWVKDVFHEDALASDLRDAGNARQMREIIRLYAPEGA